VRRGAQAGLNELLGEYQTAVQFRVRCAKILDALLATDHPVGAPPSPPPPPVHSNHPFETPVKDRIETPVEM
jgi:hypothetical protein